MCSDLIRLVCSAVLVFVASAASPAAQPDRLALSVGVQLQSPAGLVEPSAILSRDFANRLTVDALPVPRSARISAQAFDGTFTYYSFSTSFQYGSNTVEAGEIYQQQGSELAPATEIAEKPAFTDSTRLAGIAIYGSTLYFVTDGNAILANRPIAPQDVVTIEDGQPTTILDGSELGVPKSVRITALEVTGENRFLLSFSGSFDLDSLIVRRGDILAVELSNPNTFEILVPREESYGLCQNCYITSMSASVDDDLIFRSNFYNPWGN